MNHYEKYSYSCRKHKRYGHFLYCFGGFGAVQAQPVAYPSRPIRIVVPFTPGGSTDILARAIGQELTKAWGQSVIVDKVAKPGQLNYDSGGNGSAANLATEYFKMQTGTSLLHIPYRGTAPAMTDLLGGQIQLLFTGAPAVIGQIKNGQLRALAVSSPQRLSALPDVPTVAESGYKGFEADQWYGVVAPAGTPRESVAKLNVQINQALNAPELKSRLTAEGAIATPGTPEVFGKLIETEIARWKPVIGSGRVRAD